MASQEDTVNDVPVQVVSAELQHSGADIFAGLVAADTRVHVKLAAADYSLASPDFAAPAVNEVTALKVESYTLGPLALRGNLGGRPPNIPANEVPGLIAATRDFLTKRQIADLKRMTVSDREGLYTFVRKLADNKGIRTTDRILRERII